LTGIASIRLIRKEEEKEKAPVGKKYGTLNIPAQCWGLQAWTRGRSGKMEIQNGKLPHEKKSEENVKKRLTTP